jgi:hypothetical protein
LKTRAPILLLLTACAAPAPPAMDRAFDAGPDAPAADRPLPGADPTPVDAAGEVAGDAGVPWDASPAEAACARYAEVYCEAMNRCNLDAVLSIWGDLEVCRDRAALRCLTGFTAPGSSWTPADQDGCNGALSGIECAAFLGKVPRACWKAGTLPAGTPCAIDVQCQGGLCRNGRTAACGTCSERQAAGGPCTTNARDCDDGLTCSARVCIPYRKQGEPCDRNHECELVLACIGAGPVTGTGVGTCQRPRGPGEPCDPRGSECEFFPEGLDCKALTDTTGTCQHRPPLAAPGQRCGRIAPGLPDVACRVFDLCDGPDGQQICVAAIPDGDPCSSVSAPCRPGSHCRVGFCRFDDPALCQ